MRSCTGRASTPRAVDGKIKTSRARLPAHRRRQRVNIASVVGSGFVRSPKRIAPQALTDANRPAVKSRCARNVRARWPFGGHPAHVGRRHQGRQHVHDQPYRQWWDMGPIGQPRAGQVNKSFEPTSPSLPLTPGSWPATARRHSDSSFGGRADRLWTVNPPDEKETLMKNKNPRSILAGRIARSSCLARDSLVALERNSDARLGRSTSACRLEDLAV